jgi:acyl carrier protein
MRNLSQDRHSLRSQLKQLVADMFRMDIVEPEMIGDDEPLIGGILDPESLDALEFAICVEEQFGIAIARGDESDRVFATIASLADFIYSRSLARSSHALLPAAA